MSDPLFRAEITAQTDLVRARQQARRIASLLRFEAQDQVRIATAVSEIARHLLDHARSGTIDYALERDGRPQALIVRIAYAGAEPAGAGAGPPGGSEDRATSLLGAQRLMDRVEVDTTAAGTLITMRKRLPRGVAGLNARALAQIAGKVQEESGDPLRELAHQNRELLEVLTENRRRSEELDQVNQELQETNRGVVALYAELDERATHLRQATELKSRFLSDMSHEFRTPLNSILALSRLLLDRIDGELTGEQERQVVYIRRAAESLSDLVNDLLDLAKVEAGKIEVRPAEFDVADLAGALRGMFRPLMLGSVALAIEEPQSQIIVSDEAKVSQILRNFLSNAIKFTERGEVRMTVSRRRGEVRFDVRDTGIGIAEADIERIFEDFVQVEGPRQRAVRGTGLGLALSKRLAELIGGRIEVQSRLGQGSTFSLTIPDGRQRIAGPEAVDRATAPAVLVVEDEQADLLVATRLLETASLRVRTARTVAEARAAIAGDPPTAIVLDIRLNGEDAWDLLTEIKSTPATAHIPVLVMTAVHDEQRALRLGAGAYVRKPVERRTLVQSMLRLLDRQPALRVLHVDDDEAARYAVAQMLAGTGRELRQAPSVEEALAMLAQEPPDVMLLDLQFPGRDGFAMLAEMEQDRARRVPTIMLTSAVLDDRARARLAGAAAILSKRDLARDTLLDSIDAASALGGERAA